MFKNNNKNPRTTPDVFNFEFVSRIFLGFFVDFEQVNDSWDWTLKDSQNQMEVIACDLSWQQSNVFKKIFLLIFTVQDTEI